MMMDRSGARASRHRRRSSERVMPARGDMRGIADDRSPCGCAGWRCGRWAGSGGCDRAVAQPRSWKPQAPRPGRPGPVRPRGDHQWNSRLSSRGPGAVGGGRRFGGRRSGRSRRSGQSRAAHRVPSRADGHLCRMGRGRRGLGSGLTRGGGAGGGGLTGWCRSEWPVPRLRARSGRLTWSARGW